jgi:hypothetical protein
MIGFSTRTAVFGLLGLLMSATLAFAGQVLQAASGQSISIVVTVVPSEGHAKDFYATQLQLGVKQIEFNDQGRVTRIIGVNPKIVRMFGTPLIVTSTDELVATDGVIELSLEDGHKLLLPIDSSRTSRINNADFLLNPQPH